VAACRSAECAGSGRPPLHIIDGQDALLDVGDHDAFGGTIEDASRQPQLLLGVFALGNVGGLETDPGNCPIVIEQRKADDQKMPVGTAQVK
jgi:hypothetical protein